jgi:iron-sulfur cluster repair protein YtfE (RIC family)
MTKEERMDKLTKESLEHAKISEEITILEKLLETFEAGEALKNVERLLSFSDKYIVEHFKFEEEEIFPLILQYGNAKEKRTVHDFQEEHVQILDNLAEIKKTVLLYDSQPDEKQIKEIMMPSRMVVKMILEHARKEDVQLFPHL